MLCFTLAAIELLCPILISGIQSLLSIMIQRARHSLQLPLSATYNDPAAASGEDNIYDSGSANCPCGLTTRTANDLSSFGLHTSQRSHVSVYCPK